MLGFKLLLCVFFLLLFVWL